MNTSMSLRLITVVLLAGAGLGCERGADRSAQTRFPGQVAAGGGTSGEVIARSGGARDASAPSGTPGIPQGAGGNTGGAAMGGTTGGSSIGATGSQSHPGQVSGPTPSSSPLPTAGAPAPQSAAERKAADDARAEREKLALAESMDRVAARWRTVAAANGRQAQRPVAVDAVQGFNEEAAQSSASGQPDGRLSRAAAQAPIRSEKQGTAQASEDVKRPRPPGTADTPSPADGPGRSR